MWSSPKWSAKRHSNVCPSSQHAHLTTSNHTLGASILKLPRGLEQRLGRVRNKVLLLEIQGGNIRLERGLGVKGMVLGCPLLLCGIESSLQIAIVACVESRIE